MTTRKELDFLLSRGRLSAARREEILEGVLSQTVPRRRYAWAYGVLAAAAGVTLLFGSLQHREPAFTAKGIGTARADLACLNGALSACPFGSKLIFRIEPQPWPVYVHAYALPARAGGERVWYFPTPLSPPPRIEAGATISAVAAVIGAEHAASDYEVHVVIARRPLERTAVVAGSGADVVSHETVVLKVISQ